MKCLSQKDLEAIAGQIISDYKALPQFTGQKISKIDPAIFAHELFGYTPDHAHLSTDRLILGATWHNEVAAPVCGGNGRPTLYYLMCHPRRDGSKERSRKSRTV